MYSFCKDVIGLGQCFLKAATGHKNNRLSHHMSVPGAFATRLFLGSVTFGMSIPIQLAILNALVTSEAYAANPYGSMMLLATAGGVMMEAAYRLPITGYNAIVADCCKV